MVANTSIVLNLIFLINENNFWDEYSFFNAFWPGMEKASKMNVGYDVVNLFYAKGWTPDPIL